MIVKQNHTPITIERIFYCCETIYGTDEQFDSSKTDYTPKY